MTGTTKKKLAACLVGASLLGSIGVAFAHGPKDPAQHADWVQRFDTNKDGTVDASEKQAVRAERRAKMEAKRKELKDKYDANKDGTLDEGERKVLKADKVKERFKSLDTNNDGMLSQDEFAAAADKMEKGKRLGRGFRR